MTKQTKETTTMFKVVVIDDEAIVRKGIINVIDWRNLGCQVVGEASNGADGFELIEKEKPDIIITDINMPEIDGLEMIKTLKDKIPLGHIIVLTGYREFDYIQEALRLGVHSFLLKPSKINEITSAIKSVCLELNYKNKREESFKQLESHYKKSLPLLKEKLLFEIMYTNCHDGEGIEEQLNLYGIEIDRVAVLSIHMDFPTNMDMYQKHLNKFGISNAFIELMESNFFCESVNISQKQLVFVLGNKGTSYKLMEGLMKEIDKFQLMIKSCFDLGMTLCVSSEGIGWKSLSQKAKECETAYRYQIYYGEDALILYDDIETLSPISQDINIETLKNDIISSIRAGNEQLVKELNKAFYSQMQNISTYKTIYKELVTDILEGGEDLRTVFANTSSLEDYHHSYEEIVYQEISRRNKLHLDNICDILKQSLDYIHKNYRESISLNDIADYTYVSTYYLSRMFKREIGKNFVEYLNEYRIEKAKVHLRDYELKTYEVADLVGISDPHYFSKLFKRYVGMTPRDYRTNL